MPWESRGPLPAGSLESPLSPLLGVSCSFFNSCFNIGTRTCASSRALKGIGGLNIGPSVPLCPCIGSCKDVYSTNSWIMIYQPSTNADEISWTNPVRPVPDERGGELVVFPQSVLTVPSQLHARIVLQRQRLRAQRFINGITSVMECVGQSSIELATGIRGQPDISKGSRVHRLKEFIEWTCWIGGSGMHPHPSGSNAHTSTDPCQRKCVDVQPIQPNISDHLDRTVIFSQQELEVIRDTIVCDQHRPPPGRAFVHDEINQPLHGLGECRRILDILARDS